MKNKKLIISLIILLISFVVLSSVLLIINLNKQPSKLPDITPPVIEKPKKEEYKLSLAMVGDALIHEAIYYDARLKSGGYDFKPMLENIKPIIKNYDLAFYNQETILGGVELGLSHYPTFNSPYEVGDAFLDAGFNLVNLATNHTLDRGEKAVVNSANYWQDKPALVTGSFKSVEDREKIVIKEKNGIKYAMFGYTTSTNGIKVPYGKDYLVNVYSAEKAKADIEKVKDKVDVIMVSMHWGVEYSHNVSQNQKEIASYLSSLGVNLIIGHHPHVIEPIEYINDTLVIYSLGNFISAQYEVEKKTGIIASADITKTIEDGKTTIKVINPKATLIYTKSLGDVYLSNFKVYPYSMLDNNKLPNINYYKENFTNILKKLDKNITVE